MAFDPNTLKLWHLLVPFRIILAAMVRFRVKSFPVCFLRADGDDKCSCVKHDAAALKSALERRAKGSRDKHHWVSLTDLWAAFQLPAACRALDPNTQADIERSRLNNVYPDLDNTSATKQFLLKCAYGSPLIDIALCSLLQSFTLTSPYGPERDNDNRHFEEDGDGVSEEDGSRGRRSSCRKWLTD